MLQVPSDSVSILPQSCLSAQVLWSLRGGQSPFLRSAFLSPTLTASPNFTCAWSGCQPGYPGVAGSLDLLLPYPVVGWPGSSGAGPGLTDLLVPFSRHLSLLGLRFPSCPGSGQ